MVALRRPAGKESFHSVVSNRTARVGERYEPARHIELCGDKRPLRPSLNSSRCDMNHCVPRGVSACCSLGRAVKENKVERQRTYTAAEAPAPWNLPRRNQGPVLCERG
jgi:hypothetical protein